MSDCNLEEDVGSQDSTVHAIKVANHYNKIEEKGLSHRNQSRILFLRNFNNWIKSIVLKENLDKIAEKCRGKPIRGMDLACGKGGDLLKWEKGRCSHIVFADIAENSIADCQNRFNSSRRPADRRITAEFIVIDLTKERLRRKLKDPSLEVDLTSCQFALHYAFESLPQAECLLLNAADCLRVGGYFIGTIPDAAAILAKIRANGGREFGNEVFQVKLDFDGNETPPLFGAKYHFQLEGVVNCAEFLVHFPTLERLAKKFGLELEGKYTFSEYFNKHLNEGKFLLQRMSALETYPESTQTWSKENYSEAASFLSQQPEVDSVGTMSKQEWEVASLYLVFIFKKVRKPS